MKDDVEIPAKVPAKRKVLENPALTLDLWLAVWANDDSQPPGARKRAQEERDRRKALVPDVRMGVIVGDEGMTPAQRDRVLELLSGAQPTEIHFRLDRVSHLRRVLLPIAQGSHREVPHVDEQELVRASTSLLAAPKESEKPGTVVGVWEAVRYAKHRKVPVRVVMPSGEELT